MAVDKQRELVSAGSCAMDQGDTSVQSGFVLGGKKVTELADVKKDASKKDLKLPEEVFNIIFINISIALKFI